MTPEPWRRRHPLPGCYAAVYDIGWGGILIFAGACGFDPVHLRPVNTGLVFVAMLLGSSVGGLAMTVVLDGHAGLRRLRVGLMR